VLLVWCSDHGSARRALECREGLNPTLSGQSAGTNERLKSVVNLPLEMGLRYRHSDLCGLRRCDAGHRLYRGSGRHSDDPRSPEDKRGNLRTFPVARKPGAAWSAVRLTTLSWFNPRCRSLEADGRVAAGRPTGRVRTWRLRRRLRRWAMTEWSGNPAVKGRWSRRHRRISGGPFLKRAFRALHFTGVILQRRLRRSTIPALAATTQDPLASSKLGSGPMPTASTTWSGCGGQVASSARPVATRMAGGWATAGSCVPNAGTVRR